MAEFKRQLAKARAAQAANTDAALTTSPHAAWTAATSSCRTGGSRVLLHPTANLSPLRPPRHSLHNNGLSDGAKQAVKDAAGSGVSITFYAS